MPSANGRDHAGEALMGEHIGLKTPFRRLPMAEPNEQSAQCEKGCHHAIASLAWFSPILAGFFGCFTFTFLAGLKNTSAAPQCKAN